MFERIADVPKHRWNGLLSERSCTFSHEFWEVIEASGLNDFQYRYLIFSDHTGTAVGSACFYSVTTDIAIFAPKTLRDVLIRVRRIWPGFLMLRMLECGTPVTLNSPGMVGEGGELPTSEMIELLNDVLQATAKKEGQLLIVVRDFEDNAVAMREVMMRCNFCWSESLPNTYLNIEWPSSSAYLASMKSYYRSKLLKQLRRNQDQGVRYELRDDFDELAEVLCQQWLTVHEQADEFQREVLTPAFYRELSQRMGTRAKVLLFYRRDQLVGHALLLHDGDMLRWLYFGRGLAGNDSLYFFVGHAVIETAIALGARRVELGLTTYGIKRDLGATVTPIWLAVRTASRLLNPLVELIYPILNRPPTIRNRNIFKRS